MGPQLGGSVEAIGVAQYWGCFKEVGCGGGSVVVSTSRSSRVGGGELVVPDVDGDISCKKKSDARGRCLCPGKGGGWRVTGVWITLAIRGEMELEVDFCVAPLVAGCVEWSPLGRVAAAWVSLCGRVVFSSQASRNHRMRFRSDEGIWEINSGVGGVFGSDSFWCWGIWVSSMVRDGGEEGGSHSGKVLEFLQESWELDMEGEVTGLDVGVACLCFSEWVMASRAVIASPQGAQR